MTDPYLKRAFDISELPENVDLDSPPVTGFDYLYRVRLETKKCPKVVVSNIDTTRFIRHQTVTVDLFNGFIRATPGFEPDSKWQKNQLNLFIDTREKLFANVDHLKSKFPRREFPKVHKKEDWCRYSLGKRKFEQIYGVKKEESEDDDNSPKQKKRRSESGRNPPLLSIVLYLTHPYVTKLISYHVDWLEKAKFSHEQGEWLYVLLLCLQKPLQPDTCALLRSLSRVCSTLRSGLSDPTDEALVPLNIIITIISQYFDQKDMSDNFPNA